MYCMFNIQQWVAMCYKEHGVQYTVSLLVKGHKELPQRNWETLGILLTSNLLRYLRLPCSVSHKMGIICPPWDTGGNTEISIYFPTTLQEWSDSTYLLSTILRLRQCSGSDSFINIFTDKVQAVLIQFPKYAYFSVAVELHCSFKSNIQQCGMDDTQSHWTQLWESIFKCSLCTLLLERNIEGDMSSEQHTPREKLMYCRASSSSLMSSLVPCLYYLLSAYRSAHFLLCLSVCGTSTMLLLYFSFLPSKKPK